MLAVSVEDEGLWREGGDCRVGGSTLPPSLVLALETGWALRA